MKKTIPIAHKGITIKVRREVTSVNGNSYTNYVVHDYTSGRLARHKRSSLEEAKAKAREIAERMASGREPILDLRLRSEIHRALESIQTTGLRIDAVCLRFVEAFNILGNADELLSAARFWRERRPDKPLAPKSVKAATDEFLAQQKGRLSAQRHRTPSWHQTFSESIFEETRTLRLRERKILHCSEQRT